MHASRFVVSQSVIKFSFIISNTELRQSSRLATRVVIIVGSRIRIASHRELHNALARHTIGGEVDAALTRHRAIRFRGHCTSMPLYTLQSIKLLL